MVPNFVKESAGDREFAKYSKTEERPRQALRNIVHDQFYPWFSISGLQMIEALTIGFTGSPPFGANDPM
jgi:hypothetical protein